MNIINEPKELKKIAAKMRKELLAIKHEELAAWYAKLAEGEDYYAKRIKTEGIEKMIVEYGTNEVQCTKSHGVQTIRVFRNSLFDEETVKKVASKYPIHQVADVVSSACYFKSDAVQMAFQYNR